MILVIGYGRAGKRHTSNLEALGYDCLRFDPYAPPVVEGNGVWHEWESVLTYRMTKGFEAIVIATPPALHLEYLWRVAWWKVPVFCEKPLCDFGQLESAMKLQENYAGYPLYFTWNYRWHPSLLYPNPTQYKSGVWWIRSKQSRAEWPAWGFLLDHISHSLDTLYWKSGLVPEIGYVEHETGGDNAWSSWNVVGQLGHDKLQLVDYVDRENTKRRVDMRAPEWYTQIPRDPTMFHDMWRDFDRLLRGEEPVQKLPTLYDAIVIQRCLEECYRLGGS